MLTTLLALLAAAPAAQDTTRFHQGVDYRIEARLDEETDVLHGRARLRYTNRSAATLDTLWIHQHLNAFRPNSDWARRDLRFGVRRFQELDADEHAYERFTAVEVDGRAVRPVYPGAPDSTVAGIPLPAPLRPGETITVRMDWDARLSTLPRRQGRSGRHYDFAQWYPRVAVYDWRGWQVQPLLPQGEFYGEFASFDVSLDLRADQVLAATGVPVEGNPGWKPTEAERGFYAAAPAESLGLLDGGAAAGRKRVRWRAEQVHHFGWSTDPAYQHEGTTTPRAGSGDRPIAVHVLHLPGDTAWDDGVALGRTVAALDWLQRLFGPYPWPQASNVHRLESGGTEFPMLIMNGSPSEGLIVHEMTHQYLHGILANNEWAEGWVDEGFTSFVDTWYFEDKGERGVWDGALESIRERERAGATWPIARPGAEFPNPSTYSAMTYTKTSLVMRMLREMVGADTMRTILRELYRRHRLQHITEGDLVRVAEEVSGRELDWFFRQWLHTTDTLDYAVGDVVTTRMADGRWRTRVEVLRLGAAWMPVTLAVGSERRTLESRERAQTVEVVTPTRPTRIVLDPENVLLDLDPSNNATTP